MTTAAPISVSRTDFVLVNVLSVPRAVEFYEQVLGLEVSVRPHDDQRMPWGEVETGNVTLAFFEPARMGREFVPSRTAIALRVDVVHAARAALEAAGIAFDHDTIDSGVCHMAGFSDPDGNALMLHARYAPPRG
jgi:catechol 2,3-dioxygenase-like lactoylglutathione lyase family enzyme